jgi:hypothetical protein
VGENTTHQPDGEYLVGAGAPEDEFCPTTKMTPLLEVRRNSMTYVFAKHWLNRAAPSICHSPRRRREGLRFFLGNAVAMEIPGAKGPAVAR